jgi:hypothetical protein
VSLGSEGIGAGWRRRRARRPEAVRRASSKSVRAGMLTFRLHIEGMTSGTWTTERFECPKVPSGMRLEFGVARSPVT